MLIEQNISLKRLSFWGIGGMLETLYMPMNIDELAILLTTTDTNITLLPLGKGSNTAYSDDVQHYYGISYKHLQGIEYKDNGVFEVLAGTPLQTVIEYIGRYGYSDMTCLSGIPGDIGAAVFGNAGAFGGEIKDFIARVEWYDREGERHIYEKDMCDFRYRNSAFKDMVKDDKYLYITRVWLINSTKNDVDIVMNNIELMRKNRWDKYPKGRTGGSTFKNPEGMYAGKLIEMSGLKGYTYGDIRVSSVHANFLENTKNALQTDVIHTIKHIQNIVYTDHNVLLDPEIRLINSYGKIIDI